MVGRRSFPIGVSAYFQGLCMLVSGRVIQVEDLKGPSFRSSTRAPPPPKKTPFNTIPYHGRNGIFYLYTNGGWFFFYGKWVGKYTQSYGCYGTNFCLGKRLHDGCFKRCIYFRWILGDPEAIKTTGSTVDAFARSSQKTFFWKPSIWLVLNIGGNTLSFLLAVPYPM